MQHKTDDIENELNEKQKAFCREYIYDWNGTRAYLSVYKDVSYDTASVNASRLLSYAKIQAFIKQLKDNLAETAGISQLMVLLEHKKLAFSSIAHLHNTWITRKELDELTEDQKACIQEISTSIKKQTFGEEQLIVDVEYVKIKLFDKTKSLEAINKMLGWDAPAKVEHSGEVNSKIDLSSLPTEELLNRIGPTRAIEGAKKSE